MVYEKCRGKKRQFPNWGMLIRLISIINQSGGECCSELKVFKIGSGICFDPIRTSCSHVMHCNFQFASLIFCVLMDPFIS